MGFGKTIRIYLPDGTPSGIRHAEVVNWTGQALVCPRLRIPDLKEWPEAQRPGVYFLFGIDEEKGTPVCYIGEAENVRDRLSQHVSTKEFWTEAVLFTSKDDNLTKSHVKYLESRLITLAAQVNRYNLANGTSPQVPTLPRSDRDAMEEYIDHAQTLLGALGHKILEPVTPPKAVSTPPMTLPNGYGTPSMAASQVIEQSLFLKKVETTASGRVTDEGFVIFANSQARINDTDAIPPYIAEIRRAFIDDGTFQPDGDHYRIAKDILLTSPSAAAAVVLARSSNGRTNWRNAEGTTLKDLEDYSTQPIYPPPTPH